MMKRPCRKIVSPSTVRSAGRESSRVLHQIARRSPASESFSPTDSIHLQEISRSVAAVGEMVGAPLACDAAR